MRLKNRRSVEEEAIAKKIGLAVLEYVDLKSSARKRIPEGYIDGDVILDELNKIVGPPIGNRIQQRRIELKMSQQDLAAALKTSQSEVSKIEAGERALSYARADQIGKVLKCKGKWILLGRR